MSWQPDALGCGASAALGCGARLWRNISYIVHTRNLHVLPLQILEMFWEKRSLGRILSRLIEWDIRANVSDNVE